MKHHILGLIALGIFGYAGSLQAALICPTTANTNSDCGYIITIGSGGVLSGAPVAGAAAYDGADDALIGVINNSGSVYNSSFVLIGSGNGGGLFDFDGDGICSFISASFCSTASTGYEGPITTFSNILTTTVTRDTGTVNISGLADGATTYFSLESSPASINGGGGPAIGGAVPEPGTTGMLGAGLLGLAWLRRKKTA